MLQKIGKIITWTLILIALLIRYIGNLILVKLSVILKLLLFCMF